MSDEPKAAEDVSAEVAGKPAETQGSEREKAEEPAAGPEGSAGAGEPAPSPGRPAEDDAEHGDAKDGDAEDDAEEFSITGSLPEPRTGLLAVLAGGVLALDVLTKVLSVAFLEDADPVELFGGALYLTFVRNPGAAFGLAEGWTWVLALIAFGVAGFILWISRNLRSQGWAVGLGLVLGGAVGNLADRLFREPGPMRGHVVDFLSLFDPFGRVWPVFNVADMAIVGGGVTIIVLALMQHDYDGTVHKDSPVPVEPAGLQEPK
ncbi:signal peptidase II [Lentzea xinjiangensis]|uniref:Lipoprotein signal peptidase n=1 Tax=Lentzea xinjiangensis TaxID=402600 RepID=A0A1H9GPM6_9PSEU|nr:signal peptidase II [Lentzea xinjiangensis]SEQ52097.1 signal peptidase II [Lentzea xinjiangensis]